MPPPTIVGEADLKTHSYLDTGLNQVPVYAPTAIKLTNGAFYLEGNPGGEYILTFDVSCEISMRLDHITQPIQSIRDAFGNTPQSDTRGNWITPINFETGDLIGYTTGTIYGIWDFGVYNSTTTNRYAPDPNWNNSSVYTTAVCPYDYFPNNLKSAYTDKFGTFSGNPADGDSFCQ